MYKIIGFSLALVLMFLPNLAFSQIEMIEQSNSEFSIQYPSTWFVKSSPMPEVQFLVKPSKDIRDELDGTLMIKKIAGSIPVSDPSILTSLTETEKELCLNDPTCENFSLIDTEIFCLNDKSVYSYSFQFIKDGFKTNNLKIVAPIGNITWVLDAYTIKITKYWEAIKTSSSSFVIADSQNTCKTSSEFTSITPKSVPIKSSQLLGSSGISTDSEIIFEKPVDVNIILVGDKWSNAEIDKISDNLRSSFEPLIVTTNEKAGIRYLYTYNFLHTSEEDNSAFFSFIQENKLEDTPNFLEGLWMAQYKPSWVNTNSEGIYSNSLVDFYRIDAEKMEKFLFEQFVEENDELKKSNSVNLFFLKPTSNELDFTYNYYVQNRDKSTNEEHAAFGMMGYGGNYNLYFFDLLAIPWIEFDFVKLKLGVPDYKQNLYQCSSSSCFAELVGNHVDDSLLHIATPSYLYPVEYSKKYLYDVAIYSKPGASIGLTPQTLKQYLNEEKIHEELEDLYPFSDSEIKVSVERRDTRGVSYDFKKELESLNIVDLDSYGEYQKKAIYLNSQKIQPYLLEWADGRRNLGSGPTNDEVLKIVPTLMVVDVSQYGYDVYLDDYGVTGFAPAKLEKKDDPCCALGVTDDKALQEGYGVSDLVLHEVGHVLGLNHPFFAWDEFGDMRQNGYFNWYSSPMTYFSPKHSCEYLYDLLYENLCGIASASFTEFEKEHIANGILISLVKKTKSNVDNFERNYGLHNDELQIKEIEQIIDDAIITSQTGDNLSQNGAISKAVIAFEKSKDLVVPTSSVEPGMDQEQYEIPEWIRNNAEWWAHGAIGDSDFVSGIQYLIKEEVIHIPETSVVDSTKTSKEIPAWVKNNADWWSQKLISDNDFIKGIQFLVENGIINIS